MATGRLVPKYKAGEIGVDTEALLDTDDLPPLPRLKKFGEGLPEIQDLDALHQSPNSVQYQKDAPSEMTRRLEWAGSQSADTADHGDVPVEESDDRPETEGFGKRASVFPRLFAKTGGVNFRAIPPVLRRIRDHELFSQALDQAEGQLTQTGFDKTIDFVRDELDLITDKKRKKSSIRKYAYVLEGHTTFQGIPISIENDKGSVRKGVDKDGKPWKTEMKFPYGYIDGTKGADGEEVDVYVGPDKSADKAYVVQQRRQKDSEDIEFAQGLRDGWRRNAEFSSDGGEALAFLKKAHSLLSGEAKLSRRSGSTVPSAFETFIDRCFRDSKFFSDGTNRVPVLTKLYSLAQVPETWSVMKAAVIGLLHNLEIRRFVIQSVSIDVVYDFLRGKWTSDQFFHDHPMFQALLVLVVHKPVFSMSSKTPNMSSTVRGSHTNEDTWVYDECKVMLGFGSKAEAKDAFLAHYNSPKFLGPVKEVPMERLVRLLEAKKKLTKIALDTTTVQDTLDNVADTATDLIKRSKIFKTLKPVLDKVPAFEKEAVVTPLLLGALSHVGANLAYKGMHGTKFMRRRGALRLAEGVRDSISGTPRSVLNRAKELYIGPETAIQETAGRQLGALLRGKSEHQKRSILKKLRKGVALNPEIQKAPIFEDAVPAINNLLSKKLPTTGAVREASTLSKAAPYLGIPALAATEPHALVHVGVNKTRQLLAESKAGKNFLREKFVHGVTGDGNTLNNAKKILQGGSEDLLRQSGSMVPTGGISKLRQHAYDTLVSPAALTSYRVGNALRHSIEDKSYAGRRLIGALHGPAVGALKKSL